MLNIVWLCLRLCQRVGVSVCLVVCFGVKFVHCAHCVRVQVRICGWARYNSMFCFTFGNGQSYLSLLSLSLWSVLLVVVSIVLCLGVTIFWIWMNGVRTYDEPSELVDIEWRLPARFADDDGATSTDLWMLPEEDRFLCDDEDIADAWSVVQHITHIHT